MTRPHRPPLPGSPVSRSTAILVVSLMVLMVAAGIDLSLGAPWAWWLIPLAAAVLFVAISAQRFAGRQRMLAELRSLDHL